MFDSSHLVPNLNKMMEEEAVQVTQAETGQEEERVEARAKIEQPVEETIKRRRGVEEARAERREEKVSDLVSELAYFAWRDKLQHRDFIGENCFSKLISPFLEIVERKGWHLLCEHKAYGFVDVVKEFYTNMVGMKDKLFMSRIKGYSSVGSR